MSILDTRQRLQTLNLTAIQTVYADATAAVHTPTTYPTTIPQAHLNVAPVALVWASSADHYIKAMAGGRAKSFRDYIMRFYVRPVVSGQSGELNGPPLVDALLDALHAAYIDVDATQLYTAGARQLWYSASSEEPITDTGSTMLWYPPIPNVGTAYWGAEMRVRVRDATT